jgi:hypothetical protein
LLLLLLLLLLPVTLPPPLLLLLLLWCMQGFEPVDLDELQAALEGGTTSLGSAVAQGPGR